MKEKTWSERFSGEHYPALAKAVEKLYTLQDACKAVFQVLMMYFRIIAFHPWLFLTLVMVFSATVMQARRSSSVEINVLTDFSQINRVDS